MRIVYQLFGALAVAIGLFIAFIARAGTNELFGLLLVLIGVVLLSTGSILAALNRSQEGTGGDPHRYPGS